MSSSIGRVRQLATFFDVGFTSLTTLVLSVISARSLGVQDFGRYGIWLTIAGLFLSVVQGGLIDYQLTLTRERTSSGFWCVERWFPYVSLLGIAALVGGVATSAFGMSQGWRAVPNVVSMVVAAYLYVRQYWVRACFLKEGREWGSLYTSAFNLGMALILGFLVPWGTVAGWDKVWILHIVAFGGSGLFNHRRIAFPPDEEVSHGAWRMSYAWENLILISGMQISSVIAAPRLGLQFNAGLRGGSVVMGPLNVLFSGVRLALLPRMASKGRSAKVLLTAVVLLGGIAFSWLFISMLVVTVVGDQLLGSSRGVASEMLPWVGMTYVTQGAYLAGFVYARGHVLDHAVRIARVVQLVVVVCSTAFAMLIVDWRLYLVGSSLSNIAALLVLVFGEMLHFGRGDVADMERRGT